MLFVYVACQINQKLIGIRIYWCFEFIASSLLSNKQREKSRFVEVGMNEHIRKPINLKQLKKVLAT